jgi:hypothetical protein
MKDHVDKSRGIVIIVTLTKVLVKIDVYYESRKRDLRIRLMNEGRWDERLKTRVEESRWASAPSRHDGSPTDIKPTEPFKFLVYYESIKREPKIRGIKKCRCDERLKLKQRNLRASHTLGWSWNWNT